MDEYNPDDEGRRKKKYFGLSLQRTPCLRTSLLTGVGASMFLFLGQFFHSGVVRRATHWGATGFFVGFLTYCGHCNYERISKRRAMEEIVLREAKVKEELIRQMLGKKEVDAYDKMFKDAHAAEEDEILENLSRKWVRVFDWALGPLIWSFFAELLMERRTCLSVELCCPRTLYLTYRIADL